MNESSNLNSCVIELHYCLNDGSHSMDAFIFNECEREFLSIVKEVIKKSGVKVEVEVEALGQGGLRSRILFNATNKEIRDYVLKLIMAAMMGFVSGAFGELGKICVDSMFDSPKTPYLYEQVDEIGDIIDYKEVEEIYTQYIDGCIPFWKKRSNYYECLNSCEKVKELIMSVGDETGTTTYFQHKVEKFNFTKYIITNNEIDSHVVRDASIEITSPVIKGKGKWTGIFNSKKIHFNLCDKNFINKIRVGQISFKEGSTIICHLVVRRKIDNRGKVCEEYEVISVQ